DRFTFSALDAFFLVYVGTVIYHGDRVFWTDLLARMSQTSLTDIAHLVFILLTALARGWDHLHQRRLIIFLGDIACLHTRGQMDRLILRAKGKPHCQTQPFSYDGARAVCTLTVFLGIVVYDLIGNSLHIIQ